MKYLLILAFAVCAWGDTVRMSFDFSPGVLVSGVDIELDSSFDGAVQVYQSVYAASGDLLASLYVDAFQTTDGAAFPYAVDSGQVVEDVFTDPGVSWWGVTDNFRPLDTTETPEPRYFAVGIAALLILAGCFMKKKKKQYHFDGSTYAAALDRGRLSTQMDQVKHLMRDGEWRTLAEIQGACHGSETAISARLRDLRKPRFGEFQVSRRRRGEESCGLWEYRITEPGKLF